MYVVLIVRILDNSSGKWHLFRAIENVLVDVQYGKCYNEHSLKRRKSGMVVDVKISIIMQTNDMSTSVVMGPPENASIPEEDALKKLVWPYNFSNDSALLPGFTHEQGIVLTTT